MTENYKKIPVKTVYMQMLKNPEIEVCIPENAKFEHVIAIDTEEYKTIFKKVGDKWGWSGRLIISEKELEETLLNPEDEIYILKINSQFAGFFELLRHNENDVELIYMGLNEDFIGKGYGKLLLKFAVKTAWKPLVKRFWLHTCELDHEDAVKVYEKAGFQIFNEKIDEEYYPKDFLKKRNEI
jgi:GNAT superfamily N-acetyltransferase